LEIDTITTFARDSALRFLCVLTKADLSSANQHEHGKK
jgi:hypothetical protein